MSLARIILVVVALAAVGCGDETTPTNFTDGGAAVPVASGETHRFDFDDLAAGAAAPDFITVLGDWKVQADGSTPSGPNALRQTGAFFDADFPRVVVAHLTFTNLTLKVRCRVDQGEIDQVCGLMFRLKDSDNYFLTRANALEGNLRLYTVVDGDREETESTDISFASGEWHTLEATADGKSLSVSWDGKVMLRRDDDTFAKGKIGLWTKADAVTTFDDFEATEH